MAWSPTPWTSNYIRPPTPQTATPNPINVPADVYGTIQRGTELRQQYPGYDNTNAYWQVARAEQGGDPFDQAGQQPRVPTIPTPTLGRVGNGSNGGGGGPVGPTAEDKANALRMSGYFMDLVNSPMFKPKYDKKAAKRIRRAKRSDMRTARGAYNTLDDYMNTHRENPYAAVNRQRATKVNPRIASLARSQGVSPAGYRAEQNLANTQGRAQAQNYNALNSELGAGWRDEMGSRRLESQQARAAATTNISAADNAMQAFLEQQLSERQQGADDKKLQILLELAKMLGPVGLEMPKMGQIGFPEDRKRTHKKPGDRNRKRRGNREGKK